MNYLAFDVMIGAALLLFVLQGKKKGFILTLCGLLAVFVAFIGATVLSDLMCAPVGRLIQPMLETSITQALERAADQTEWTLDGVSGMEGLKEEQAFADLPALQAAQAVAALEGTEWYHLFGDTLKNALKDGALQVTTTAAAAIAKYLAREIARIVLFLLSFVVVLFFWFMLSHMLDLAFRLPVLSSINGTLGAVLGLIKGALLIFITVWLLKGNLSPEGVEKTFLLKFFYHNSPLSLIAQHLCLADIL